jgi:excisionase family DNA binding protein
MTDVPTSRIHQWQNRHPEAGITPIRKIIIDLVRRGIAWRWSDVWGLTGGLYTQGGVKKYLSVLIGLQVVKVDGNLIMRAGPCAKEWMAKIPRTRPGGSACRYRYAQEAREQLKKEPRRRREPQPEIPKDLLDPLFTVAEVAQILGSSTETVAELIRRKELRTIELKNRLLRIFQSEVCRYIRMKREAMYAT